MDRRILLLFVINIYCVYSSPYNLNQLVKRGEKLCGDRLTSMLRLVCNGIYYGPSKKSYNGLFSYGEYDDGDNDADQNELIFPFLHKEYVKSLIPRKSQKSVGIVNECCYNSCSREHLMLYCGS